MDFLAAAKTELETLEQSLRGDPRMRKIEELRRLISVYEDAAGQSRPRGATTDLAEALITRTAASRRPPLRDLALDAARAFLDDKFAPTGIREVFEAVREAGISLGGQEPQNNLSALMSKSDDFKSFGRPGWMLKKNLPEETQKTDEDQSPGMVQGRIASMFGPEIYKEDLSIE